MRSLTSKMVSLVKKGTRRGPGSANRGMEPVARRIFARAPGRVRFNGEFVEEARARLDDADAEPRHALDRIIRRDAAMTHDVVVDAAMVDLRLDHIDAN